MKLVIFGLSVSSSWGNGHATLWRGLIRALGARGHDVVFFERDVPYYAAQRDLHALDGGTLILYDDWQDAVRSARPHLAAADVAMVTSYCPDGVAATELVLDSPAPVRVFYDLDTPITLDRLEKGAPIAYIGPRGLRDFDLVLSYTGGEPVLNALQERLGARRVAPLYGSADPEAHVRTMPRPEYHADLSYIGTYAEDRQHAVSQLLIEPARRRPDCRFVIAGAMYPSEFPWTDNIYFVRHLPPGEHPAFYSSARLTLNVTRAAMARMGYCPSARLFEAAACGCPVLSDEWSGIDTFFEPGREILIARNADDALGALDRSDAELRRIAEAARERVLSEHTAVHRARDLEEAIRAATESAAPDSARREPIRRGDG